MASWPPKKNAAFVFYVGLVSQADTKLLQANPTLAAGDVKVATDDAAPVNLATLPVVDADFTDRVKVSMSAGEMNGDRVTVIFSDAAGAEWGDLLIDIPTSVRQIDDLSFPTVSGRSTDVLATGEVPTDFDTTIGTLGATQIEANALDGKGDWNIGKSGYSLTQVFPTNFADLSIVVTTGLVDITQTAADKVWSTTVRTLTAFSTALALSVWDVLESAIVTASSIGLKLKNSLADTGEPGQGAPPVSASSQTKIDWLFKNFRNKKEQTASEYRLYNDAGAVVDSKATVSDAASVTTKEEMASGP